MLIVFTYSAVLSPCCRLEVMITVLHKDANVWNCYKFEKLVVRSVTLAENVQNWCWAQIRRNIWCFL